MIGLILAVIAAIALSGTAAADEAPRFPFEIPADLMRQLHDGPVDLSYALVGLPDGGAAIQVSARTNGPAPFHQIDLDDSIIVYLDRRGRVKRRVALPPLSIKGGEVVRTLVGGQLLLMYDVRGFVFFASVAPDGSAVWQRGFDAGTYGSFPPPIATASGGIAFLDEFVHSHSCLLRPLDKAGKNLAPVQLQDIELLWEADEIVGGFLLQLSDGGFLAQCAFSDRESDITRYLLFRVDRDGRELWQRHLPVWIVGAREEDRESILIFGNLDEIPESLEEQWSIDTTGWATLRLHPDSGKMFAVEYSHEPFSFWPDFSSDPAGNSLTLPGGGMIVATRLKQDPNNSSNLQLARIDRNGGLLWVRPIILSRGRHGGNMEAKGIAVVDGKVLVAVDVYGNPAGAPPPGIYVVPFD